MFPYIVSLINRSVLHTSVVMCLDITNYQIGIALGYHRQHPLQTNTDNNAAGWKSDESNNSDYDDGDEGTNFTTSITPLPPLPYMSRDPHHPSYAFHQQHRPTRAVAGMPTTPPRVERTMEVATQLAQLAKEKNVKGVLVRWPGGGGGGGGCGISEEELAREIEEGRLLLPGRTNAMLNVNCGGSQLEDEGTMGYRRGRIMYLLEKCCTRHSRRAALPSLLMEGIRPFALWDTTNTEDLWSLSSKNNVHLQTPMERVDKYGNSLTEMDAWGRAAIFGMPPKDLLSRFQERNDNPQLQHQGKFYYSSKHRFTGSEGRENAMMERKKTMTIQSHHSQSFDSLHDAETKISQLQGSLPAMHALGEFATVHLGGRIVLPSWAPTRNITMQGARVTENSGTTEYELFGDRYNDDDCRKEIPLGYRRSAWSRRVKGNESDTNTTNATETKSLDKTSHSSTDVGDSTSTEENPPRMATLVNIPKKRRRGNRSKAVADGQ